MEAERLPSRVYSNLLHHVSKVDVKIDNALDVVKSVWYVIDGFGSLSLDEKKKVAIQTLEDIAAGDDGVLDTDDDIIPGHVLKGIKLLIECNLVIDMIDLLCEVTQSKQLVSWSMQVCRIMSYVLCCCSCKRKKEKPPQLRIKSYSFPSALRNKTYEPLLNSMSLPSNLQ